jgi:hypothetical protein
MTHTEYQRKWRKKNPAKQKEYNRRWRERNPSKAREYARKHRQNNPEAWKTYHLKSKYGITAEQREEMIAAQDHKCGICKCELDDPHVDHIEEPFKLRGILCHNCNVTLGLMKDSPELLRAAADYLEKYA